MFVIIMSIRRREQVMLKSMNEALDYIESHLHDEIDNAELEIITGTSIYHFRRMFSFISGMSLGYYIRNRNLSNGAFDIKDSWMCVMETAFKYGYESVVGFSRDFRECSEISPSEVKGKNMLKAFPKLTY